MSVPLVLSSFLSFSFVHHCFASILSPRFNSDSFHTNFRTVFSPLIWSIHLSRNVALHARSKRNGSLNACPCSFFYLSQPVGCDGVVGSGVTMDACGVCGGQGKGCRLYEGIFMEPILPRGHQPVTSIPKGAMSLNISELRHSSNFLGIVMKKSKARAAFI